MQVSVESTSTLERRIKVEVPAERIQGEVDSRLKSLARTTKIDGFRPGKVPFSLVRKRYEQQVRQEVMGEVVQNSFYEAITQEKLQPAGMPAIDPQPLEEGKGLEYVATFEVYPTVQLAPLDGVEIEKPVVEISDSDVDEMMDKVRKQQSIWVDADRRAENGDQVIVDFVGTIEGESFPGNEGKKIPVVLGSGRMISGFEEQLVGVKAGDDKTLDLSFPENYHYKEVAGKPVQFAVKVHKVQIAELPALDDEFAKAMGVEEGGIERLRSQLKESMELELTHAIRKKLKQQVSDKLFEVNSVEVPSALVEQEIVDSVKRMGMPADTQLTVEQKDGMRGAAQKRVAIGLLFSEVIKSNSLSVPSERLREEVEKLAASYEDSESVVQWYYGDKNRLAELEAVVLEDMIVDWVMDHARVTDVQSSFAEVVGVK